MNFANGFSLTIPSYLSTILVTSVAPTTRPSFLSKNAPVVIPFTALGPALIAPINDCIMVRRPSIYHPMIVVATAYPDANPINIHVNTPIRGAAADIGCSAITSYVVNPAGSKRVAIDLHGINMNAVFGS